MDNKLKISPEVITTIIDLAAVDVMGQNARKGRGKWINMTCDDTGMKVDLTISVKPGVKVPELCTQLQMKVKNAVENMTSITVDEVNISIVQMNLEKSPKEA